MAGTCLSLRIDLSTGHRIGPGKIALLEAIRSEGSISGAARHHGMSYRRAWLLIDEINTLLRKPAVVAVAGGQQGGHAVLTPIGEQIVEHYRKIEGRVRAATHKEFRAIDDLTRRAGKGSS
jgi:molybdate transport system regulatory protein